MKKATLVEICPNVGREIKLQVNKVVDKYENVSYHINK